MSSKEKMLQTQGLMVFLGALGNGLETLLGRGAASVCFQSGRTMGIKRIQNHLNPELRETG